CSQSVELCLPIYFSPDSAPLHAYGSGFRIHPYPPHERQVDHHPTVAKRRAGYVVTTTLYGYEQVVCTGKVYRFDHVCRSPATGDEGWSSFDHAVPDDPSFIVL